MKPCIELAPVWLAGVAQLSLPVVSVHASIAMVTVSVTFSPADAPALWRRWCPRYHSGPPIAVAVSATMSPPCGLPVLLGPLRAASWRLSLPLTFTPQPLLAALRAYVSAWRLRRFSGGPRCQLEPFPSRACQLLRWVSGKTLAKPTRAFLADASAGKRAHAPEGASAGARECERA